MYYSQVTEGEYVNESIIYNGMKAAHFSCVSADPLRKMGKKQMHTKSNSKMSDINHRVL